MGRKQNNKKVKKDQTPSEEEVSDEELELNEDQQLDQDQFDGDLDEDLEGDSVLLIRIEQKLNDADDEEKLSWAAIYEVKKQQAELNEEMQKEIDSIKEKYEIQRIPLMHKISDAVSGKKLDKSIYSENEFVKSINLNKTKPKALKDYWSKVFDGCGLIGHENDVDLLQKLTFFKIELIDAKVQDIRLMFQFEENQFIGNKLFVQVEGNVAEGTFKKKVEFEAKSTKLDENSLFGTLTGSEGNDDDQEFLDICHDLYRAYVSSTYFYFYEPTDDLDEDEGEEGGEENENDEDSDEDDQDEVKVIQKPKGSSITQKPECKNQ